MKREKYVEVVELYAILEEDLGNVLNVRWQDLMEEPRFVKVYRLILGHSLKDFAFECNIDSNLLKNIEKGEKLESNLANRIYGTINRLIENEKLEKTSIDILSKNYLTLEIIKSKNLQTLAKYQTRYLTIERPNIFMLLVYFYCFLFTVPFISQSPLSAKIFALALLLIAVGYHIFLYTQFFLWNDGIISNFIHFSLKNSPPESTKELKKIMLFLADMLDVLYIKYVEPDWHLSSIREELANVIRYYIHPNINETNKNKFLSYFENISIFSSCYSIEQYDEIKKTVTDIKSKFIEKKPEEISKIDKSINLFNTGISAPIFNVLSNINDIFIKTLHYWILAFFICGVLYILTKNLSIMLAALVFSGQMFVIHNTTKKSK